MSATESAVKPAMPVPVGQPLTLAELAATLIKHYDLHEGQYKLLVEYQIGTGTVGPNPESLSPGLLIGFAKFGLLPTNEVGPHVTDAAVVNPAKKPRKVKG